MDQPRETPFSAWSLGHAEQAIADAIAAGVGTDAFDANKAYIEEQDHYQGGDRWLGPTGGDNPIAQSEAKRGIERQFCPVHLVGEVLETAANALLQHEPEVTFVRRRPRPAPATPETPEAAARLASADARERDLLQQWRQRLADWAAARRLTDLAREAVRRGRWAARGALRTWLPPETLEEATEVGAVARTLPRQPSPEAALARIQVLAPLPDQALVYEHPDTHERCGIYLYQLPDGTNAGELWYAEGTGAARRTVCRLLRAAAPPREGDASAPSGATSAGAAVASDPPLALPIGGRLPIAELRAELLITETVRRQQAALDFYETLKVRVAETAGFPERYTLNAAPNGMWVKAPPTDTRVLEERVDAAGVTWYLIAVQRTLGSAITTELRGVPTTRADGSEGYETPDVRFKDPTDPAYLIKLCEHERRTILRECKQGHVDTAEQSGETGVGRLQARWHFLADANNQRPAVEQLLADTYEAALAIAGLMNDEARQFLSEWRVQVRIHVDAGPLTPDEIDAILSRVEKGVLTLETALALMGIEDVAGELERLASRPDAQLALRTRQGEALQALVSAGLSLEAAAQLVGFAPDEMAIIRADLETTDRAAEADDRRRQAADDTEDDAGTEDDDLAA